MTKKEEPVKCKDCSEEFVSPGAAAWHWDRTGHRIMKPPERFLRNE